MGDSLGISDRGTKAKTITSCDNAFVTNILLLLLLRCTTLSHRMNPFRCLYVSTSLSRKKHLLPKRLIGRPQEALLCSESERQRQCFNCAKAKRQRQSAQPERKSTSRLAEGSYWYLKTSPKLFSFPTLKADEEN